MSEIKPRKPWFANRLVEYYENDTEPKQFPDAYTQYIEISAYDKLKAENEKAKELIGKLKELFYEMCEDSGVDLEGEEHHYGIAIQDVLNSIEKWEAGK